MFQNFDFDLNKMYGASNSHFMCKQSRFSRELSKIQNCQCWINTNFTYGMYISRSNLSPVALNKNIGSPRSKHDKRSTQLHTNQNGKPMPNFVVHKMQDTHIKNKQSKWNKNSLSTVSSEHTPGPEIIVITFVTGGVLDILVQSEQVNCFVYIQWTMQGSMIITIQSSSYNARSTSYRWFYFNSWTNVVTIPF